MFKVISKEKYLLNRVTSLIESKKGVAIDKEVLKELMEQWTLDYKKEYGL